ncbi:hypothetical protein LPB72_10830 [Hydrogenophaga crassostreae]|uniref:Uncharacterized protein n=1 Tax=Hydrogenophaga crassostreae TaxID=1763535 RepID=A0A167HVK7_9BURK|nr:hypothetical protein LPB072_12205 [Hydrogenophaga crassostreae]OAD41795.1 hypothetical protein LPB72_10830 [Hydrogenophaga crassostreae]
MQIEKTRGDAYGHGVVFCNRSHAHIQRPGICPDALGRASAGEKGCFRRLWEVHPFLQSLAPGLFLTTENA